jgi:CheY-like chemotaxis protein
MYRTGAGAPDRSIVRMEAAPTHLSCRPRGGRMTDPIIQVVPGRAPLVLVVDDFPLVLAVVRAGLERHGFGVLLAGDGREAIDLYERDHHRIALVLLDVQMPVLDGPRVLTVLRTIDPDVRAFFMTGDAGRYTLDDLLAIGARRVFFKPLNFPSVAAELRQNLAPADREECLAAPPG